MKILATGATGFLGAAVTRELVKRGHDVTGLVHRKARAGVVEEAGAAVLVGDLLTPDSWTREVKASDAVISLSQSIKQGERISFPEARRRSYYHGQMVGNLFLAAQDSRVKGVMVSYGVLGFGNRGDRWVAESDELIPTGFERSVSGAFWHIDKTSRKTKVPLVNIFTGWVYGPGGWFADMAHGIQEGSMNVVGAGDNYMSLMHIHDLAEAYCNIVDRMPLGERICLVDEDPVTQKTLAAFMADCLGCGAPDAVDMEVYSRLAGDLAAESMTCSVRMSCKRMKGTVLPGLKYPSCRQGIPELLKDMGLYKAGPKRIREAAGF